MVTVMTSGRCVAGRFSPSLHVMNRRRLLIGATAGVLALIATSLTVNAYGAATPPSSTNAGPAGVDWHTCPTYSDQVLRRMMPAKDVPAFREQWARAECGKVSVPLDYDNPDGKHITIAITRLPATNKQRRKGSIAFNPGGPGGSGYLMPIVVTVANPENKQLNEQYDLIGFDPRGVGYSTKVRCENPGEALPPLGEGPISRSDALALYRQTVQNNVACGRTDPAFLREITTPNIARDLDRIRSALGEEKLSYFGGSWGTWLGAVYRSEVPHRAARFWLDSVMPPKLRMDALQADGANATAQNLRRFAMWIARHDETYGFGTSSRQVEAALARLSSSYDAKPRKFTDLPHPLDGFVIGDLAAQPSVTWPHMAKVLRELRDATGPTAPPTVKETFGEAPPPPPAGAPQQFNPTMAQAAFCNEDSGKRDFESWWAAYQDRLKRYPVTGRISGLTPTCAGWPLPVQQPRLKHSNGSLVLSGHRYEAITPYEWTWQMRSVIGGTVQTVGDDLHGAVLDAPECAAKVRDYFATGRVRGYCRGEPEPTTTDPAPSPQSPRSTDRRWPANPRTGHTPGLPYRSW